jgi:hypothetical protein
MMHLKGLNDPMFYTPSPVRPGEKDPVQRLFPGREIAVTRLLPLRGKIPKFREGRGKILSLRACELNF